MLMLFSPRLSCQVQEPLVPLQSGREGREKNKTLASFPGTPLTTTKKKQIFFTGARGDPGDKATEIPSGPIELTAGHPGLN